MDLTFKMKSSLVISGPTQCGKSTFVHGLLLLKDILFDIPPSKIYWFYGQYSPVLDKLPYIIEQGLPVSFDYVEDGSVVVIDDLMQEASDHTGVTALFTKLVHHKGLFVINITQNFFHRSKETRTRRLNSQYIMLFKNPSDATQIQILSKQMYPSNSKFLTEVYRECTKRPHGYVLIDLRQETPEIQRIRSNILEHEFPMLMFAERNTHK